MLFALLKHPEGVLRFVLRYAGYPTEGKVPFGHPLHLTPLRGIR
jgi:hypothetical protein